MNTLRPKWFNSRLSGQIEHYQDKLAYEIDSWDLSEVVVVVDTRSPEAYEAEHIPGAVSLPHRSMTAEGTRHLKRDALYIT